MILFSQPLVLDVQVLVGVLRENKSSAGQAKLCVKPYQDCMEMAPEEVSTFLRIRIYIYSSGSQPVRRDPLGVE